MSPSSPTSAAQRALAAGLGLVTLAILVTDLVTVGVRAGDDGNGAGASPPPAVSSAAAGPADSSAGAATAIVDSYYSALTRGDARSAYELLCRGQQSVGYAQYAAEVTTNETTGTGVIGWHPTSPTQVLGNAAQTPGVVTLAGGVATPIVVQAVLESTGWRVCSSDLGGILPAPGTAAGSPAPSSSAPGSSA